MNVTDEAIADIVISRLNEVLKVDPEAVKRLIETRVECSEELADHPTVQVRCRGGEPPRVGFLGMLNGLIGSIPDGEYKGWGYVSAIVEEDGMISGFRRTGT